MYRVKLNENTNNEIWKKLDCLSGQYAVSNMGRIRNIKTNRILTPTRQKKGYLYVSLWVKNKAECKRLHKLVAIAFVDNPEGKKEVHHIDGNKENCCADNLQWVTRSENMKEYFKTHKQRSPSSDERERISAKLKGRTLSEETRERISAKLKGRTLSEETKNKLRNRIVSEETKKKQSEARKGRHLSDDHRAKIKAGLARRKADRESKLYVKSLFD